MPPNESKVLAWSRTAYRSRPLRTFKEIRWLSSEADMSRAVATNQLARGSNDPDIVALNGALSDVATFRYMRPSARESAGARERQQRAPRRCEACRLSEPGPTARSDGPLPPLGVEPLENFDALAHAGQVRVQVECASGVVERAIISAEPRVDLGCARSPDRNRRAISGTRRQGNRPSRACSSLRRNRA